MYLSICCCFLLWAPALTLKNLNYSVPEEQGAGTVIGNIGKDARLQPGLPPAERGGSGGGRSKSGSYRVLENSAPHLLDVDVDSGLLYTKQRIDRESLCRHNAKCQLSLEVFANDKEICMIKVEIQDINDNAPSFPSDQIEMDISENAAPGTRFPLTSAHDPDAGENGLRTYLLTRDDHGLFALDVKSRGDGTKFPELVIQKALDREQQNHHTLVLTALDGGEPPRSATVQINVKVIDSNDNSPVFEAPSYLVELPENAPLGTVVIDLNATDADEGPNGEVLYSFSSYVPDRVRELFSIDPKTGLIRVKGNLDYEENGMLEIDVQARDLGPNPIPAHCKVTVKLIDRNDNAPSIGFVSVRQGALSEAAPPGTVIALVRVTDRDSGKNGQLQCRVLGGGTAGGGGLGGPGGSVPFKLEENYDNFYTVVTDRPLDRETQDEYNVTIVARDGGSPPLNSTKSFAVKILDENDNPPRFTKGLYVLQVHENNIPGEYLGSVLAQDPDLGQNGTVSYSILPSHIGDVSIYTYVSVNPTNGAIYALRSFNYEQTKAFEFKVLAKDSGAPAHLESNATVRVTVLDVNDNAPVIVLPTLQNDTAELQVPRNAGLGYLVSTVRALDSDFGESGRLTYEIVDGNDDHLFEIDPSSGEIRTLHPFWEDVTPVAELVVKVTDHGKPTLSAVAKLIIRSVSGSLPEGVPRVNGEQHHWDMSLPLIVTLSTISIILLAAMITIAVKCKRENKEIRTYNCRIAEYSHPQLGGGKGKKKKINKNDIMLVQSEVEERNAMNVMNVVSSPSLATSPMYFDYQTRLPLSSPRSEVMYLKPASNNLTVPQGHAGCHTSFTGQGTNASETPATRMSIIQTDNFPAEPNYMGSRQQFVQSSSTFKDPERASLRDSGHGDSDQADSDQDTNKGSCCDMSVREALKMKTTSTKSQPLEQAFPTLLSFAILTLHTITTRLQSVDLLPPEPEECVNCTDECRVLGHSDRCWMPQFPAANQAENADYRTNLFVPTVETNVETESYETVNPTGKKTFCTFGKDKREHTILIANVKPYLKAKRALSPLLQEVPSASSSPTKACVEPCTSTKGTLDGCEAKAGALAEASSQYVPTDSQYLSPSKQPRDPPFPASDQMARVFADVHSRASRDSSEMGAALEQLDHPNRDLGRESVDADEVVREIDKLLQDCRGNDPVAVRK
ncbi:PREDICTED: protocadherin-17 isoform X1 [Hipposideros armiger]|uniref:Protocadherin-17 isoform X1 n=1 Tax=Hipposideros armiger TaxID=186990 RepID=A0A8B7SFQ7_HIPAR|nr:PREDICTED: protocadherin-17 isoform X1 [Hipposideros armiger]XP_019511449.1 PREDICTED: protocadherin-17 isoform X1 [Hipposideros armiger]